VGLVAPRPVVSARPEDGARSSDSRVMSPNFLRSNRDSKTVHASEGRRSFDREVSAKPWQKKSMALQSAAEEQSKGMVPTGLEIETGARTKAKAAVELLHKPSHDAAEHAKWESTAQVRKAPQSHIRNGGGGKSRGSNSDVAGQAKCKAECDDKVKASNLNDVAKKSRTFLGRRAQNEEINTITDAVTSAADCGRDSATDQEKKRKASDVLFQYPQGRIAADPITMYVQFSTHG
jgi:hypothetical protein